MRLALSAALVVAGCQSRWATPDSGDPTTPGSGDPLSGEPLPGDPTPGLILPATAAGFGVATQQEGASDADGQVDLFGGQLRVCWAVAGEAQELSIRVGDATIRANAPAGCSFAREKAAVAKIAVRFLGSGRWTVRVEEQARPEGQVRVPTVGDSLAQVEITLRSAGLVPTQKTGCDPRTAAGSVIDLDPRAGAAVATGSTVTVTLNRPITIPSVIGKRPADAERQLKAAGLLVEVVALSVADGDTPRPNVVGQYPDGGELTCPGESVSIEVERSS